MGDIARCSIGAPNAYYNEDLLYRLFGINAELLIDHAWGWEPCTIKEIKAYQPSANSISSGQVLQCPYPSDKARLVVHEMTELLVLDLVDKGLVTDQIVLTVGYDIENLTDQTRSLQYKGPVTTDRYGRRIPKHAHGSSNLGHPSSSTHEIVSSMLMLFDKIVDPSLLVRRLTVVANRVIPEGSVQKKEVCQQLDLFTDYEALEQKEKAEQAALEREKKMQHAMLQIKKKYGKNAILKGTNLLDGATAKDRNQQIGGHKA
jgi:DNA polymerase V